MLILLSFLACAVEKVPAASEVAIAPTVIDQTQLLSFMPLPENYSLEEAENPAMVVLGEKLFNEKGLSLSGQIACSSCHDLSKGGADGRQFSVGHSGALTRRNSPTVFNASGQLAQFWDGRATDVEVQALGHILSTSEMAMPNGETVVSFLEKDPTYVDMFAAAFPGDNQSITFEKVGVAIGAYERTLLAESRWDLFLRGDSTALSETEKQGFNVFLKTGCQACHNGTLLGGQSFMKLGLVNEWHNQTDLGRFEVTGLEADKMVFKVPQLRMSTLTAPYFHDGSAQTLNDAVKMMAWTQLGKSLPDNEANLIVAWLASTEKYEAPTMADQAPDQVSSEQ
jgi:cytochrome c peroxidase